MAIEFYIFNDELWYITEDGTNQVLSERDADIIQKMITAIRERYPEAYKALSMEYQKSALNVPYYQFLIVRRFCKCNFGKLDTTNFDVDNLGRFNFEKMECPLRGECKNEGIICCPKFNSKLSPAEERVMSLIYQGYTKEEVGDKLSLSPNTVKQHVKSAYCKLGIHDKGEFVKLAKDNGMFNNKSTKSNERI